MAETLPLRARLACCVCNAVRRLLRLLGHGGTNLPCKPALRTLAGVLIIHNSISLAVCAAPLSSALCRFRNAVTCSAQRPV